MCVTVRDMTKKKPHSIYVSPELLKRIKAGAKAEHRTVSNYIEVQMERYLAELEKREKAP